MGRRKWEPPTLNEVRHTNLRSRLCVKFITLFWIYAKNCCALTNLHKIRFHLGSHHHLPTDRNNLSEIRYSGCWRCCLLRWYWISLASVLSLVPYQSLLCCRKYRFRSLILYYTAVHVYTVFRKNTHSHFLSYLHELFVFLNKNYSEYTQGLIDSDNVKITYSLWSMT